MGPAYRPAPYEHMFCYLARVNTSASANGEVVYLYFDEGGNFDFTPKGTAFFTMTAVVLRRPFAAHSHLLEVKYDCLEEGLGLECFHATEDRQAVRDRVFDVIQSQISDFSAYSVIIRKDRTIPSLRPPERLYPHVFEWLVKYSAPRVIDDGTRLIVAVTDALPLGAKKKIVEKSLRTLLKQHLPRSVPYRLYHHRSSGDLNLQVADYFNWAVFRKWESGDDRSYRLVQAAIRGEGDLFAGGDRSYY
jgi:hypothetical protein